MPKKVKHRKWQKGRSRTSASARGHRLAFGMMGLKALSPDWISARQIEAARRAMTRSIKRGGKIWIRVFPDKPCTAKGAETPMGKGKGTVDRFVVPVKPGKIIFEIDGVPEDLARESLQLAAHKLSVKTTIVMKERKDDVGIPDVEDDSGSSSSESEETASSESEETSADSGEQKKEAVEA